MRGRAKSVGFLNIGPNDRPTEEVIKTKTAQPLDPASEDIKKTKSIKPLPALIPISEFKHNLHTQPKQPITPSQMALNQTQLNTNSSSDNVQYNDDDFEKLFYEDGE